MKKRELTCISCPMGCQLQVDIEDGKVLKVTGNSCKRGEVYAQKECTNPTRIVTSTVKVKGGKINAVSVKTSSDIPKDMIFQCIDALRGMEVKAPVKIGDIIVKDVAGTGVDIVATKNVEIN
jgi:CxxC motif-containing protein